ncbi:MAG TPA: glycosyltransferase [Chloroflexota bacterium]|nr:glycosyltransferase [Chloroflexota bacterium]
MDVSIVIRAKNEARFIGETLEAIGRQDGVSRVEVIVVDSGSTDGTLDIVRRFPVRLIEIPPATFTYGRALNLGVAAARGDVVVSLSAHSLPAHERWLANLVRNFADARVAGVYGRQIPRANASIFDLFGMTLSGVTSTRRRWQEQDMMFSNANGAFRRRLCRAFPFDERLLGAEDLAWAQQVQAQSYAIVYEPGAPVYHSHGESLPHLLRRLAKDQPTIVKLKLGLLKPAEREAPAPVLPEGS